jgi:hypothetical protein
VSLIFNSSVRFVFKRTTRAISPNVRYTGSDRRFFYHDLSDSNIHAKCGWA